MIMLRAAIHPSRSSPPSPYHHYHHSSHHYHYPSQQRRHYHPSPSPSLSLSSSSLSSLSSSSPPTIPSSASSVIMGTSAAVDTPQYQQAVQVGLQSGITAIQISRRRPVAERVIGNIVNGMHRDNILSRSHIHISARIGQHISAPASLSHTCSHTPGAVPVAADRMLCLSGEFIRDQVHHSLAESGLEYIDLVLLDNIDDAVPHLSPGSGGRTGEEELYERLPEAFAALEEEMAAGRIGGYGVGMWGSPIPSLSSTSSTSTSTSSSGILDLSRICHAAGTGLQAVQIPSVPNMIASPASPASITAEEARRAGLWVIGDRPLTHQDEGGKMLRYQEHTGGTESRGSDTMESLLQEVRQSVSACAALEDDRPFLEGGSGDVGDDQLPPLSSLSWGHIIGHNLHQIDSLLTWHRVRRTRIEPELEWAIQMIREHPEGRRYHGWMTRYRMMTLTLLNAVHRLLKHKAAVEMDQVQQGLDRRLFDHNNNNNNNNNNKTPEQQYEKPSIPHCIVSAVLGSGYVDSVVVGMNSVDEVLDMATVTALDRTRSKAVLSDDDVQLRNINIEMGEEGELKSMNIESKEIDTNNNGKNNNDNNYDNK